MKMKLLAAAAMVAGVMAAAPAFAQDGYIDANYVNISGSAIGTSTDAYNINFATSSMPAPGSFGFQLNGGYLDGGSVPSSFSALQATVMRNGEGTLWGGYVAYSNSFGNKTWEGGVVGRMTSPGFTLTGQLGYGRVDDTTPKISYWSAAGNATFYANDNLSFSGLLNYADANKGAGHRTQYGVQAEWKPEAMPASFTAGYSSQSISGGGGHANVFMVGARWNFGGKSLKERDQSGLLTGLTTRINF